MTVLVLVDHARVRVAAPGRPVVDRPLHPAPAAGAPEADVARWCDGVRDAVVAALPARDRPVIVLAIGLGLTEIAMPALPPIDAELQRGMLERDADRYFPMDGPMAVAWQDGFAFAMEAPRLRRLRAAIEQAGTVHAIVTVARLLAQRSRGDDARSRRWIVGAGDGEWGVVALERAALREVRRLPQSDHPAPDGQPLDDAALLALVPAASALGRAGDDVMLVDAETRSLFAARGRRQWYRSGAGFLAASLGLLFALDYRAERALQHATARHEAALLESGPARATRQRLLVVTREQEQRAASDARPSLASTLDLLGRLLPADAFVERLEWDGEGWRIDGSAASAARLVPILDADPALDRVRVLAASTRFVDRGRQRESFSIAFAVRPVNAATSARVPADLASGPGGARGER